MLQETLETPDQSRPQHGQQLPQNDGIGNATHQDRPQEYENFQAEIDDIINQLEVDDAVRNVIAQPYPVEDEGIALDPFEEIQDNIHEFDFALEVELADY